MTTNIGARQRWATTHYQRMFILTNLIDQLGLTRKEDFNKDLQPHRMKKNSDQFTAITDFIDGNNKLMSKFLNDGL